MCAHKACLLGISTQGQADGIVTFSVRLLRLLDLCLFLPVSSISVLLTAKLIFTSRHAMRRDEQPNKPLLGNAFTTVQQWWKPFAGAVTLRPNDLLSPLFFLLHLSLQTASRSFRNLSYKRIRMNVSQACVCVVEQRRGKESCAKDCYNQ